MSRTFQAPRVFKTYTVRENMRTASHLARHSGKDVATSTMSCLASVGLADRIEVPASTLSQKETKLLSIAMSLATSPELLLLDEPAAGLNDEETHDLVQIIRSFAVERRITICIIEHKMHVIMNICDQITVLSEGRVLAEGRPEDISKNQDVIDAYLGVPDAEG